ncbi:MAG: PHP domain-containing protein [Anaerolineae bacterium]
MAALTELLARAERGEIALAPESDVVNMHCHTFFSFNAYGYSPAALAWLAKKRGYRAIGIVDFDVLDGADEFLQACDLAGVRGSVGIETRVFIPEFATREINSPGEPGIYYHMGIGFTSSSVPPAAAPILAALRARADRRNRAMLARLNAHLAPLVVDYERNVLPLTPAGNATERHMLQAIIGYLTPPAPLSYEERGRASSPHLTGEGSGASSPHFTGEESGVRFWSEKLNVPADQIAAAITDYATFSNLVRGKLMKRGGVGYIQPTPEAFPTVEEYHTFIQACGALPCATWLDGLSAGEQAIHELLQLLIGKGVVALNIVPDRNWNIPDPELRRLKVARLHEIVRIAGEYDLPLNVGTEMNAPGNKLVDDFDVPEMAPLREAFLAGAYFIYGHTVMQRTLGLGYQSAWAQRHLPTRRGRNAFYEAIGRRVAPDPAGRARLAMLSDDKTPGEMLAALDSPIPAPARRLDPDAIAGAGVQRDLAG